MTTHATTPEILLLNGPNLNLLGLREPDIYGQDTLADIQTRLKNKAASNHVFLDALQSNHEGVLIDRLQQALQESVQCVIMNPGALTHTSIALRDCVIACQIPMIEVHISRVFSRESFRHVSYFADIALATLVGFGTLGYDYALATALNHIKRAP